MTILFAVSILVITYIALLSLWDVKKETGLWMAMRQHNPQIKKMIANGNKSFSNLNLRFIHSDVIMAAALVGMIVLALNMSVAVYLLFSETENHASYILFFIPLGAYASATWSSVLVRCDILRMANNARIACN